MKLTHDSAFEQAATIVQSILYFAPSTEGFTIVSAKLEAEITTSMLGLHLIYTGPGVPLGRSKTIKAHLIGSGTTAEALAGRLHGEIQKGFLKAEVVSAPLLLNYPSFADAKRSWRRSNRRKRVSPTIR
jgi:hypothetical protein